MRLWTQRKHFASEVYLGISVERALRWTREHAETRGRGRYWIEDERKPATIPPLSTGIQQYAARSSNH